MRVNVDSIARGYIADRVRKIFSDYNLERGFVNLDIDKARFANGDAGLLEGGGIACYSTSPRDSAWTISIPNPADPERVIANYQTLSDAVFNAGLYQQTVQSGGRSYRFIIDPRSGEPADTGLASVSVSSKDGPLAAALAEALYVMGKDEAIDFGTITASILTPSSSTIPVPSRRQAKTSPSLRRSTRTKAHPSRSSTIPRQ